MPEATPEELLAAATFVARKARQVKRVLNAVFILGFAAFEYGLYLLAAPLPWLFAGAALAAYALLAYSQLGAAAKQERPK